MKLENIYQNDIYRPFNPAVNAADFTKETVETEIGEYVFTDEIINSLHSVLAGIRDRSVSHNGIWINGYFGSGKSHFLKFLDYCVMPQYREDALAKLMEGVENRDPLQVPESRCDVTVADVKELTSWLSGAQVETVLFNIGSVASSNTGTGKVFTEVFWNEFNRLRGYNNFNLTLAQYFEKILDEKGKFEEFKSRLDEDFGWDWKEDASELANTELDTILDLAKDIVPSLSIDVIRERIKKNDFPLSVENFMKELKQYVSSKPEKYRLVFFADEISQFIDNNGALLLQLQQLVSDLNEACNGKVWIACTAQQDLSEILSESHIASGTDLYGKIMGRFQIKISLKGTDTEYITQKRILEKKGPAEIELAKMYDHIQGHIAAQLPLPAAYKVYSSREQFADYYPFVPYQFALMRHVFDSFMDQKFVDKEVKGNERSIIKITHSVAYDTREQEVGDLISFDQFYNAMFRGSLTRKGQNAIATAMTVVESYAKDRKFAERVLNILFMICNMDEQERRVLPATAENVSMLLIRDIDCNKSRLRSDVEDVLRFLSDNNILREDLLAGTGVKVYSFFTEEERQVANAISNQYVDNDFQSGELIEFFKTYLLPDNKVNYALSMFTIGATLDGKTFLRANPDIWVDFVFDYDGNAEQYSFQALPTHLTFFMSDAFKADKELRDALASYCKTRKYLKSSEGQPKSENRKAALSKFGEHAAEQFRNIITPALKKMFNDAKVYTGNQPMTIAESTKDKARYTEGLTRHIEKVYPYATAIKGNDVPTSDSALKAKILRSMDAGEYTGPGEMLTAPEKAIENWLSRQDEANLRDLVNKFQKPEYGWPEQATLYFVNELVRRNLREYTYNGIENPDRQIVANNISRDTSRFMVRRSKEIPQRVIDEFINAWRDIFGNTSMPAAIHPAVLHAKAKEALSNKISNDQDLMIQIGRYPLANRLKVAIDLCKEWDGIRDDEMFFKRVTADRELGKRTFDDTKEIRAFVGSPRLAAYEQYIRFVQENRENFAELPERYAADTDGLKAIVDDEWPIATLRQYKKMYESLNAGLNEVRDSLKHSIREELEILNEKLQVFAEEKHVVYTSTLNSVITRLTSTNNIAALRANAIGNDWFTSEITKINSLATPPPSGTPGSGNATPPHPTVRVKKVRLTTPTFSNLKSADDIERYLDILRRQLISNLADADEIQVL